MTPKVEGKNYYPQDPPSARGFKYRGFSLHTQRELPAFEEDMKRAGFKTAGAYLRHLWTEERIRQGLPPVVSENKS